MGLVKSVAGDFVLTFLWICSVATLGPLTSTIASALDVKGKGPSLVITIVILCLFLMIFSTIGAILGGASFNPTGSAAFYAAGASKDSLFSMAIRLPAQAAGAAAAVLSITEFMPMQYKGRLRGPSLKVDVQTGAIVEGLLTFVLSFIVLYVILRGPRNPLAKTLLLSISTVTLVIVGSSYTGPSMNPANAFGWAYLHNRHNTWDHIYVYWICPFIGAILAAWLFRCLFPPPAAIKQKKA